jgi:hypothetical protein
LRNFFRNTATPFLNCSRSASDIGLSGSSGSSFQGDHYASDIFITYSLFAGQARPAKGISLGIL